MITIGKINLTKGKIDVTDPCYDNDTWCRGSLNVKKGTWIAKVNINNENRVSELSICHTDYDENQLSYHNAGIDVGVDAGLAGFFENKPNYNNNDWSYLCHDEFKDKDYGIATIQSKFGCVGVWSSSGYGDGSYDVYVANDKDEVVAAYITFIQYDDDDDD